MIKKKDLQSQILTLSKLMDEKDTKINALLWCMANPTHISLKSYVNCNDTLNIHNYANDVLKGITRNNVFPYDLRITYFDMQQCKLKESIILRSYDALIQDPKAIYDSKSGDLEITFYLAVPLKDRKYYKYNINTYSEVSRSQPRLYYKSDEFGSDWVSIPTCYTQNADSTIVIM